MGLCLYKDCAVVTLTNTIIGKHICYSSQEDHVDRSQKFNLHIPQTILPAVSFRIHCLGLLWCHWAILGDRLWSPSFNVLLAKMLALSNCCSTDFSAEKGQWVISSRKIFCFCWIWICEISWGAQWLMRSPRSAPPWLCIYTATSGQNIAMKAPWTTVSTSRSGCCLISGWDESPNSHTNPERFMRMNLEGQLGWESIRIQCLVCSHLV